MNANGAHYLLIHSKIIANNKKIEYIIWLNFDTKGDINIGILQNI